MLRLNQSETKSLLAQPESGMGYQVVEVTRRDNREQRAVALNAELLLFGNETRTVFRAQSYSAVLKSAPSSGNEIKTLRVLPRERFAPFSAGIRDASGAINKNAAPAKDAPVEKTMANEVFKRFSAYKDDRRLRADGGWLEGTYATTEEDAKNIKTGKDAVARYALPNPEPASYVFTGRPHKDTDIQRGTVEPAYDQPGGGVEVIFPKGTQSSTVTGPDKIPDA